MRRVESGLFSSVALAILIVFALACGGGGGGEGDGIGDGTTAGAGACISCHQDFSWSKAIVEDFLAGKHVIHSSHIEASNAPDGCLACHDPLGDGPDIEQYIAAADIPEGGLAAVGCENCHGNGSEHYGSGPIPTPRPGAAECGECHNADMDHNEYYPEGDNIYEDYIVSKHAESGDRNSVKCVKCHTDEGGRAYKDVETAEMLNAVTLPFDTASPIQCRTCHNPHKPTELLKEESTYHGSVTASAQYATCTNCHQEHDAKLAAFDEPANPADPGDPAYGAYDLLLAPLLADSSDSDEDAGDLIYHARRWNRVISNTHYDKPETNINQATKTIEGYTMDRKDDHVCLDCHNVHASDTTINNDWASSGHGGGILTIKKKEEADQDLAGNRRTYTEIIAIRNAGPDDTNSSWPGDDWDADASQPCQRCHTSTGFKSFAADPSTYDPAADNKFSHLVGWEDGVSSSGQNEMLYCWACHANNSGALRDPGEFSSTGISSYAEPAARIAAVPDLNGSNMCISCHQARESGQEDIKDSVDDFSAKDFVDPHHLGAGAVLFRLAGYEYDGPSYDDSDHFAHGGIGTDAEPDTGTEGPCVECHMRGSANHLFSPVTKDGAGDITDIPANAAICANCHAGPYALTALELDEESKKYQNALLALKAQLTADVYIYESDGAPSYFVDGGGLAVTDWTTKNADATGKKNMGAAFNYGLLFREKGGYAHNRYYVKRLIFDSIDFLDNGALDGTINLTGYDLAHVWYKETDPIGAVTRP